ncbi:MAG: hypothetical protein ACP5RW_03605 [bacterium]
MKRIVVLVVLGLFALGLVGGISYGKGIKVASNPVASTSATPSYTVAQNQQTSIQDKGENEANEAVEAQETNETQESAVEAENENLPGGGHADQDGVEIDHQFEGIE